VGYPLDQLVSLLDRTIAVCLAPLAIWILLSGLDDLFILISFICLHARKKAPPFPTNDQVKAVRQKRLAVFVPLWQEHRVIGQMVEHNIAAIQYQEYDFFIGGYPNDQPTLDAVRKLESRFQNVHLCLCPHDGPTSKADCLNWIYQRMLLWEEQTGTFFDVIVTHDAEDIIHPEELDCINYYAERYGMVQLPVLPLRMSFLKLTHGLYCDDFAECHTKDLFVRCMLGGFVPSSGVGTGYARWAVEQLAESEFNRVFEPSCLTEDYENGFRLHRLCCPQVFVPVRLRENVPLATREYFPHDLRSATRQRTRWTTGIALQTWERHGWGRGARQIYWFLRDRKSLVGYPVSFFANVLFILGIGTWVASRLTGDPWTLWQVLREPLLVWLLLATSILQVAHLAARAVCVGWIYGWRFALGVPVRVLHGNWLNTLSTFLALAHYTTARLRREPLRWVKTEHAYPSRVALIPHKRSLGEILVGSDYVTEEDLQAARASKPRGVRLGEHLVRLGKLTEEDLYEALSMQLGLPAGIVKPHDVPRRVARTLPVRFAQQWQVLPVRITSGNLLLASPELPTEELENELRKFTRLEIRFQLVTPTNFRVLSEQLL
jgi:adsorption protein B